MIIGTNQITLFRSLSRDGTDWVFVVGCDGNWTITRNGEDISRGNGGQASIGPAAREFVKLTHGSAPSNAGCDPAVGKLLNRIEREAPANGADIRVHQKRIGAHLSKSRLDFLNV
jgi:hypothetical protein